MRLPIRQLVDKVETQKDLYELIMVLTKMGAESISENEDRATSLYWFTEAILGLVLLEALKDPEGLPKSIVARAVARFEDLADAKSLDEINHAITGRVQ